MTEGKAAPAAASEQGSRNLVLRVAAALVLVPLAIGSAYAGGLFWIALVTLAVIGLYVEWLTIVGAVGRKLATFGGAAALAIAGAFFALGRIDLALSALGLGLVATFLDRGAHRLWTATGFAYAAAAEVASVLVRADAAKGFAALMLVFTVVWATDTGGYFAGRAIGGPKLWPRVSPKKTWAGAVGGFAASLAVAACFAVLDLGKSGPLLVVAAVLSVVSQLGDLFESALKRRFGVKDSSHIIPGHGGLLDRLDGFVAAVVVAAIFGFLRGGADGVGRGLMVW